MSGCLPAWAQSILSIATPERLDSLHRFSRNFRAFLFLTSLPGSLKCPQQKCLIHLIRDMNEDLLGNGFDNEYKDMVPEHVPQCTQFCGFAVSAVQENVAASI